MKIFFVVIFLFIFLIIGLFFIKITVVFTYKHDGKDDDFRILFRILWFITYEIHLPLVAIDGEDAALVFHNDGNEEMDKDEKTKKFTLQRFIKYLNDFHQFITHIVGFYTIIKKFLAKVSIHTFKWETTIGSDDAAFTGTICGILWAVKGHIVGLLSHLMKLKVNPHMTIEPTFERMEWKTSFTCIVSFRVGHAIYGAIKLIRHWKKGFSTSENREEMIGRNLHV